MGKEIDISESPFVKQVLQKCKGLIDILKTNKRLPLYLASSICGYSPAYFRVNILPILKHIYKNCLDAEDSGHIVWKCD